MRLLLLLLLLVSCVCLSSADHSYQELEYGQVYKIRLSRRAESVEFISRDRSTVTLLWHRSHPQVSEDSRVKVSGYTFTRDKMTTRDSGFYRAKDQNKRKLMEELVEVITPVKTYTMKPEETFKLFAELESKSCNIYFFPKEEYEVQLVRSGREQSSFYQNPCTGLEYMEPCFLVVESLESSCTGRFEIRDDHDNEALIIHLEVESKFFNPVYLGVAGFILATIFIGCCTTRCCCGRSKSTKKKTESAADPEPAVRYHMYDHEPAGSRQNQLSQPSTSQYSAQPSSATTGPLIHNPPVNVPPDYSKVFAHSQPPNTSYAPLCSDAEPRFELKGMNINLTSPLNSESSHSDVYTSDKLNFL